MSIKPAAARTDPAMGQPFAWEFHRAGKILTVKVQGRLVLNDGATAIAACLAGFGIAQPMAIGLEEPLQDGRLVNLFPDWNEECFPCTPIIRHVICRPPRYAPFSILSSTGSQAKASKPYPDKLAVVCNIQAAGDNHAPQ